MREIAEALGESERTIYRDWRRSRPGLVAIFLAWLRTKHMAISTCLEPSRPLGVGL